MLGATGQTANGRAPYGHLWRFLPLQFRQRLNHLGQRFVDFRLRRRSGKSNDLALDRLRALDDGKFKRQGSDGLHFLDGDRLATQNPRG